MSKISTIITLAFFTIAIVVPSFLVIYSLSTYQQPVQESALTTFDQNKTGSIHLNAGEYSLNLAAPLGSVIPGFGFEMVGPQSPQSYFLGTSLLGLHASENGTSPMSVYIYNESNGSLESSTSGTSLFLPSLGSFYPIEKLVAQYSYGTFAISNAYLTNGINASIDYNKNYTNLLQRDYGFKNVLSPFELKITPNLGTSESALKLFSQSQYSGLVIYFAPSYSSELNVNNQFLNTTGKIVYIGGFTSSAIQLSTFPNSNFTIPYDFISSVRAEPMNSPLSVMNVSGNNAVSVSSSGKTYNLSSDFSIQAKTSMMFSISNFIQGSTQFLKYDVSANFAQIYQNGMPVFTNTDYSWPYEYRIAAGLIEGALIGGAITRAFDIAIGRFSEREKK